MLLDTHVWIWAAGGDTRLGVRTRRRLARSTGASAADPVAVSTASVFEIVALHTAGRLRLTLPVERWVRESIERGDLQVLDISRDVAVDAGMIPAMALADPIDRCLVATAREYSMSLLTSDRRIIDYGKRTGLVRVVDASA